MFFQQHEGSQRLSDLESKVEILEEKLDIKKLSEMIAQTMKTSVDE